jgi:hypothetical protein
MQAEKNLADAAEDARAFLLQPSIPQSQVTRIALNCGLEYAGQTVIHKKREVAHGKVIVSVDCLSLMSRIRSLSQTHGHRISLAHSLSLSRSLVHTHLHNFKGTYTNKDLRKNDIVLACYYGDFEYDKMEGQGRLTYRDGSVYVGCMQKNRPMSGTLIETDGRKYDVTYARAGNSVLTGEMPTPIRGSKHLIEDEEESEDDSREPTPELASAVLKGKKRFRETSPVNPKAPAAAAGGAAGGAPLSPSRAESGTYAEQGANSLPTALTPLSPEQPGTEIEKLVRLRKDGDLTAAEFARAKALVLRQEI